MRILDTETDEIWVSSGSGTSTKFFREGNTTKSRVVISPEIGPGRRYEVVTENTEKTEPKKEVELYRGELLTKDGHWKRKDEIVYAVYIDRHINSIYPICIRKPHIASSVLFYFALKINAQTYLDQNEAKLVKVNKPTRPSATFRSHDGILMYQGDRYYYLPVDFNKATVIGIGTTLSPDQVFAMHKGFMRYSTKAAAQAAKDALPGIKIPVIIGCDRKPICEGDQYFLVNSKYQVTGPFTMAFIPPAANTKIFATSAAAKQYCLYNKPCLSIADVRKIYVSATNPKYPQSEALKQLVISKQTNQ